MAFEVYGAQGVGSRKDSPGGFNKATMACGLGFTVQGVHFLHLAMQALWATSCSVDVFMNCESNWEFIVSACSALSSTVGSKLLRLSVSAQASYAARLC